MKTTLKCSVTAGLVVVMLALACCTWAAEKETAIEFKDDIDKVSYAIGLQIGTTFLEGGIDINFDPFLRGVKDAKEEKEPALETDEIQRVLAELQQRVMAKQMEGLAKMVEENKAASQKFLDENKKKSGVKVFESGLQYKILVEGKGDKPKPTEEVMVHYRGTLMDGTEFDSSYKRGQPFKVLAGSDRSLGQVVIPGWQEALQNMPVGSKWEIYIPSDLAYGDRGSPGAIPPGSALIFEMELIEIVKSSE